jgi:hypothetical protein
MYNYSEARGRQMMLELLRSGKLPDEILRQYDTQTAAASAQGRRSNA